MKNNFFDLLTQLFRFGVVGVTAAIVHLCTVVFLVQNFNLSPLVANIFGFICGFQISYWGHRTWTFQATTVMHRIAATKLLSLQIFGFIANEFLFYLLLLWRIPYPIALTIVLTTLPIFTFFCGKYWVFKTN